MKRKEKREKKGNEGRQRGKGREGKVREERRVSEMTKDVTSMPSHLTHP